MNCSLLIICNYTTEPETLEEVQQYASKKADEYQDLVQFFTDICETTDFVDSTLDDDLRGDYLTVAEVRLFCKDGL